MLPSVTQEDAYWTVKVEERKAKRLAQEPRYESIEMPRNSATGFITAFFATVMGFAMIWHIWWLVALGLVGAYATFIVFAWRDVSESRIPASEVAEIDRAHRAVRAQALAGRA